MKNLLKVISGVAFVLMLSFGFTSNGNESSHVVDLTALPVANAWGWCWFWAPDAAGEPNWFEVDHVFPYSEIYRLNFEGKKICFFGGFETCHTYDVAVSSIELAQGLFGDKIDSDTWLD